MTVSAIPKCAWRGCGVFPVHYRCFDGRRRGCDSGKGRCRHGRTERVYSCLPTSAIYSSLGCPKMRRTSTERKFWRLLFLSIRLNIAVVKRNKKSNCTCARETSTSGCFDANGRKAWREGCENIRCKQHSTVTHYRQKRQEQGMEK